MVGEGPQKHPTRALKDPRKLVVCGRSSHGLGNISNQEVSLLFFLLPLRGAVWKVQGDGTGLKNSCPMLYNKSDTKISAGLPSHNSCRGNKEVCACDHASVRACVQLASQDSGMSDE